MKPVPGELYCKTRTGDILRREPRSTDRPGHEAAYVARGQRCLVVAVSHHKTAYIDALLLTEAGSLGWTVLHPEFWELLTW